MFMPGTAISASRWSRLSHTQSPKAARSKCGTPVIPGAMWWRRTGSGLRVWSTPKDADVAARIIRRFVQRNQED